MQLIVAYALVRSVPMEERVALPMTFGWPTSHADDSQDDQLALCNIAKSRASLKLKARVQNNTLLVDGGRRIWRRYVP